MYVYNVYNVRDFGAVGDGLHDDTEAVQKTIDAAISDVKEVFFPAGTYAVRGLRLPEEVALKAEPEWGYGDHGPRDPGALGHTVIRLIEATGRAMIDCSGAEHVRLLGLTLDCANLGENYPAIYADSGRSTFEDVCCVRCTGSAVVLNGAKHTVIRQCIFIGGRGCAVEAEDAEDLSIRDTQLSYNAGAGLWARSCRGLRVSANRVEGGRPAGLDLEHCEDFSLYGNTYDSIKGFCARMINCKNGSFSGNSERLSGNGPKELIDAHLFMRGCENVRIEGNSFWGGTCFWDVWINTYGIAAEDCVGCTIRRNVMAEAFRGEPLKLEGFTDGTVDRNVGILYPWDVPGENR